jgi:tetratricopeptide (TPR) repeat protein
MSEPSSTTVSKWNALRARWHFIRATFHRHWGNLGEGRIAYQRAVDQLTRAIEIDPTYVGAYFMRGVLYWREIQNYHHAVRDLTRVFEIDPDCTEALFNRAVAYHLRGDFDHAIGDLQRFLEIDPNSAWRESAELQLAGLHELRAAREAARR